MTSQLTQLRSQLQKDLSAHRTNPTNSSLAATALSSVRLVIQTIVQLEPPKSTTRKREISSEDGILALQCAGLDKYLTKVCQALYFKEDYGLELFQTFLSTELEEVRTLLQFNLRFDQGTPVNLFNLTHLAKRDGYSKAPGEMDVIDLDKFEPHPLFAPIAYREFLQLEIKMKTIHTGEDEVYEFIGSDAKAIELMDGLVLAGVILVNGQKANTHQMANFFKMKLRKDVANLYHKRRMNLGRKKEKAPFLMEMATLYAAKANQGKRKSP